MKHSISLQPLALILALVAAPVLAQNAANDNTSPDNPSLKPNLSRASKLIGAEVVGSQGQRVGEIKDIVLDRVTGKIKYAVVVTDAQQGASSSGTSGSEPATSSGGAQSSEKYFAIPWSGMHKSSDSADTYKLDVDANKLKSAQGFDKNHWPAVASQQWQGSKQKFYNEAHPYYSDSAAARKELGIGNNNNSSGGSGPASSSSASGNDNAQSGTDNDGVHSRFTNQSSGASGGDQGSAGASNPDASNSSMSSAASGNSSGSSDASASGSSGDNSSAGTSGSSSDGSGNDATSGNSGKSQ